MGSVGMERRWEKNLPIPFSTERAPASTLICKAAHLHSGYSAEEL